MSNFILICNNLFISSFQDYIFTYYSPSPTVIIVHHLKLFLFRNIYFGHVPPILFNFLLFSSFFCHVQHIIFIECLVIRIYYSIPLNNKFMLFDFFLLRIYSNVYKDYISIQFFFISYIYATE